MTVPQVKNMDRKSLTREYKETPRPMGVYCIRNTTNGKVFVGASVDVPSILNRHRAQLKMGGHTNRALQNDWNDLGADAFQFETLDLLAPPKEDGADPTDDLRVLEQMWLDQLSPFDERGYNARPKVAG